MSYIPLLTFRANNIRYQLNSLTFQDFRSEPIRLSQINHIHKVCEPFLKEQIPLIWTGDFNALSREEYTDSHWEELSEIRRKNCWESPHIDVTNKVETYFLSQTDILN